LSKGPREPGPDGKGSYLAFLSLGREESLKPDPGIGGLFGKIYLFKKYIIYKYNI
jgi:hypothetical protein